MLFNIISKIESVPDDANSRVKKAAEPQCHIVLTYLFEVNRVSNTMLKIGGEDNMEKTTAPEGTFGRQHGVRSNICLLYTSPSPRDS